MRKKSPAMDPGLERRSVYYLSKKENHKTGSREREGELEEKLRAYTLDDDGTSRK